MNLARIVGGLALMAGGLFLAWDLVHHNGFDKIEKPFTGPYGVVAPLVFVAGLLLIRGRLNLATHVRVYVTGSLILQVLALLPFVQPRIIGPTPGHAGVGLGELLIAPLVFGGFISFIYSLALLLTAKPEA